MDEKRTDQIDVGDYIRIDWTIPGDMALGWPSRSLGWPSRPVWVEGEVMRVHRPMLDLVAEIRVDRSNWFSVGSVAGLGIERGARCIPRPSDVVAHIIEAGSFADQPLRPDGFSQAPSPEAMLPKSVTLNAEGGLRLEEIGYDGPGRYARALGCTCRDFHNARSEDGILEAQHDAGCVLRDWRIRARRGDLQVVGANGVSLSPGYYTRMVYGHEEADRVNHSRRPDGFSQSAIDAAKAVLLAPVAKRSGR